MYFVDEDRSFTPKGYLSVYQSIVLCASKWHNIELSEFIYQSKIPFEPFGLRNISLEDEYPGHETKLIITWNKIRQSLYDGTVATKVVRSDTGITVDLPPHIWGSCKVDAILSNGSIGETLTSEFDGRVILSETDLKYLLDGISKPSNGGPPKQSLVILAPSDPDTASAYLPLGYIGIKEAHKAFHDKAKANAPAPEATADLIEHRHMLYDQAGKEIQMALASGLLPSFHIQMSGGTVRPLKATDWLPDGTIFKSVTSSVVVRYPGGWYDRIAIQTSHGPALGIVSVSAEDLLRVLRSNSHSDNIKIEETTEHSTVIQLPDRGGRPTSYDGELFLIEAAKAVLDRVPETQAQLIERALDAYEAAGHPGGRPGPDWAKRKIRPFWRRLELGKNRE